MVIVVCFQLSPAIKSFHELTDCCLVYPTFFAIRLCFLQLLNKDSKIYFAGGISFAFQAILTDDAFRHQCKRIKAYLMT